MLKYFLDDEDAHLDERMKQAVKRKFIKKRQYRPFHLDCSHSKKKLCYCTYHPIAHLSPENKAELWDGYEDVDNFYKGVRGSEVRE